MGKRLLLFLATNVLVLTTIFIVWSLIIRFTGIDGSFVSSDGSIQFAVILLFSAIVGFAGSFISLGMSRWIAKKDDESESA